MEARMLGRHICWVPSPRSPALAVWPCLAPRVPTGRDRKLPPHRAVCLGTSLICFPSQEQLPSSAGQRAGLILREAGTETCQPLSHLPSQLSLVSSYPHSHPRRRRSQSWRLMWMSSWTWKVTIPGLPGSKSCWLTVTNPLRPSSLACWTRSGACRS